LLNIPRAIIELNYTSVVCRYRLEAKKKNRIERHNPGQKVIAISKHRVQDGAVPLAWSAAGTPLDAEEARRNSNSKMVRRKSTIIFNRACT